MSSSSSLRQRRQGFVPQRKPTGELKPVTENSTDNSDRASSTSTVKLSHSRAESSVSSMNGFLSVSSGETSSGAVSPIDGPAGRLGTYTQGTVFSQVRSTLNSVKGPSWA